MSDLFEFATRNKLRFPSTRGELTAEALWDVPLRSRDDFNLDFIYKTLNKTVKESAEESLIVETKKTAAHKRADFALNVVTHVITTKLAEEEAAKQAAENKLEIEKLTKILAKQQDDKLSDLSEEALKKRIKTLQGKNAHAE